MHVHARTHRLWGHFCEAMLELEETNFSHIVLKPAPESWYVHRKQLITDKILSKDVSIDSVIIKTIIVSTTSKMISLNTGKWLSKVKICFYWFLFQIQSAQFLTIRLLTWCLTKLNAFATQFHGILREVFLILPTASHISKKRCAIYL